MKIYGKKIIIKSNNIGGRGGHYLYMESIKKEGDYIKKKL